MKQEGTGLVARSEAAEASWLNLYRLGGLAALISLILVLVDMGLSFGGEDVEVAGLSTLDWFALYQSSWFMGLRNLGFFNVISTTITIPLYLALYRIHREASPAYALLALIIFLFGAAVYNSNNRALSMLTLSSQYAQAQTEMQQTILTAAGTMTLAQAEDFTPGTFLGFFLSSTGTIMMMAVMLHSRLIGKWISLAGLIGSGCLLVFTISVTFMPGTMSIMMALAMIGGLLMMGWDVAIALKLFRLARPAQRQPVSQVIPAG